MLDLTERQRADLAEALALAVDPHSKEAQAGLVRTAAHRAPDCREWVDCAAGDFG